MRLFWTQRALDEDRSAHARVAAADMLEEMVSNIVYHATTHFDHTEYAQALVHVAEYLEHVTDNLLEGIEIV